MNPSQSNVGQRNDGSNESESVISLIAIIYGHNQTSHTLDRTDEID